MILRVKLLYSNNWFSTTKLRSHTKRKFGPIQKQTNKKGQSLLKRSDDRPVRHFKMMSLETLKKMICRVS